MSTKENLTDAELDQLLILAVEAAECLHNAVHFRHHASMNKNFAESLEYLIEAEFHAAQADEAQRKLTLLMGKLTAKGRKGVHAAVFGS